jgi:hypothetical protein
MNILKLIVPVVFVALVGCTTEEIMRNVSDTTNRITGKGNVNNADQDGKDDIEDAACAKIPYQNRTVCRIQVHLNVLGYNVGVEDGLAGRNTKNAISRFQREHNISPADGAPSYELLTRLRQENTKGGSVVKTGVFSAAACGALAAAADKDVATWAVACGATGAILQGMSNRGKEKYAMRYYEIKDENERMEHEIEDIEGQTKQNEAKAASYQSQIDNLIRNEKDDKRFIAKAGELRGELNQQIKLNKDAKRKAEVKIAILDDQINDVEQILKEKPSEAEFKTTLASLKTRKSTLIDSVNTSNGVEKKLLAQKSQLDQQIIERS